MAGFTAPRGSVSEAVAVIAKQRLFPGKISASDIARMQAYSDVKRHVPGRPGFIATRIDGHDDHTVAAAQCLVTAYQSGNPEPANAAIGEFGRAYLVDTRAATPGKPGVDPWLSATLAAAKGSEFQDLFRTYASDPSDAGLESTITAVFKSEGFAGSARIQHPKTGASGPFQFMPATWNDLAVRYPELGLTRFGSKADYMKRALTDARGPASLTTAPAAVIALWGSYVKTFASLQKLGNKRRWLTPEVLYLLHNQGPGVVITKAGVKVAGKQSNEALQRIAAAGRTVVSVA